MIRNERRKLIKQWKAKEPFKYELYKLMMQLYIDEEKTRKYTSNEAIEFIYINNITEEEAEEIINKTKDEDSDNIK